MTTSRPASFLGCMLRHTLLFYHNARSCTCKAIISLVACNNPKAARLSPISLGKRTLSRAVESTSTARPLPAQSPMNPVTHLCPSDLATAAGDQQRAVTLIYERNICKASIVGAPCTFYVPVHMSTPLEVSDPRCDVVDVGILPFPPCCDLPSKRGIDSLPTCGDAVGVTRRPSPHLIFRKIDGIGNGTVSPRQGCSQHVVPLPLPLPLPLSVNRVHLTEMSYVIYLITTQPLPAWHFQRNVNITTNESGV